MRFSFCVKLIVIRCRVLFKMPKREQAGTLLLVLCAGAFGGWLVRGTFGYRAQSSHLGNSTASSAPSLNTGQFSTYTQSAPGATARSSGVGARLAENPATVTGNRSTATLGIDRLPTGRANSGDSFAAAASGTDSDANSKRPDSYNPPKRTPLQDLLNSSSIGCTFGAGNSAEWPGGKIRIGTSAWQGGPVDFDAVNIEAGTAQMTGSGVTRMGSAPIAVTAVPTDSGLNFSGVVGHGTLVAITVFSALDAGGHHIAVMSSHGLTGLESAQFYGTCDTAQ